MTKKKKRRRSAMPAVIILTVLLLVVITLAAIWYFMGNSLALAGEWEREIDLTAQVTENISEYITSASYGEEINVTEYIDQIKVVSHLSISKDGEWKENVDIDSYEAARGKAREALKSAVTDLLSKRITDSYIDTDKSIDELVSEAVGMELTAYLEKYGPKLMPTYEELMEKYGSNMGYSAGRESLVLSSVLTGDREYTYMSARGVLVVDGVNETIVYHKSDGDKKENSLEEE